MLRVGLSGSPPAEAEVEALLREYGAVIMHPETASAGQEAIGVGFPGREVDPADWHLVVALDQAGGQDVDVRTGDLAGLWRERLVPFAENLRTGRRAPRRQQAVLTGPDPTWPDQARRLIARLARALGEDALRIDHIGSTSVPGLQAKELIDIQVVVADLDRAERASGQAAEAGLVRAAGTWTGLDAAGEEYPEIVLVDADPGRPVNVNLRPVADPVWRETILFRDWLRADPSHRDAYLAMKRGLADRPGLDVNAYSDAKLPWISDALGRAEDWARQTGWQA